MSFNDRGYAHLRFAEASLSQSEKVNAGANTAKYMSASRWAEACVSTSYLIISIHVGYFPVSPFFSFKVKRIGRIKLIPNKTIHSKTNRLKELKIVKKMNDRNNKVVQIIWKFIRFIAALLSPIILSFLLNHKIMGKIIFPDRKSVV